jgi:CRP-like cAMP-binding protein
MTETRNPRSFRLVTPIDCLACPARGVDLFAGTSRANREDLLGSFRMAAFAAKDVVYRMGERAEYLYLVRSGLVKLVRYSAGGAERIVQLARTGDTFGLAALCEIPYRRTAVAMSRCELCRVPAEVVLAYNRHHPEFVPSILAQYQRGIDVADTFLTELSTGGAHARIARLMLFLAERQDEGESPLVTREEMGSLLGLTTETASRVMAEFRREHLIEVTAADRCRCDIPALEKIALV